MSNSPAFQVMAFVVGIAIGVVYYLILAKNSKSNRLFFKTLLICALSIVVIHTAADMFVISHIAQGEKSWFSIFALSLFHSFELFIFQTHFFDNGYQEYLFGHDFGPNEYAPGVPWLTFIYIITFILAILTSIALVIKAINRRRAGRSWLIANRDKAENVHIFFLGGEISVALAEDIRKQHPDQPRILVGYPDPEESYMDLSIWEKIQRLFKSRTEESLGPFSAIVYSRVPLSEVHGKDICQQMNIKDLDAFLKAPSCKVYLLGDDESENLHCAEVLHNSGCTAEIFCRACREGVNRMYEDAMTKTPSMNVHLVDSSYLAVRNIKNCTELLPVNYVDKGVDAEGRQEGWVSSPFNAMILGFGETGREVLAFLYEHGSFVGKDYKKSPFSCCVVDRQMANIESAYRNNFPGMNESAGITYKPWEIGGNAFWDDLAQRIDTLNYIVVCLGDDRFNLRIAVDLVEYAYRHGKDLTKNFLILIAQENPSHLDDITLQHYNAIEQYHDCIRTFGNQHEVWTYDNMTNESLTARAKNYFAGYQRASGETRDADAMWEDREKEIKTTDSYKTHAKRVRQRSQDFANCFHVATKLALIGPEIYDHRREIAQCIPADYDAAQTHYTGDDAHVERVLHYLAVHEHIRWEASHVALGYTPGKATDEVKKTHACIMSYDELTPKMQHYDYLVIKTTFDLQ